MSSKSFSYNDNDLLISSLVKSIIFAFAIIICLIVGVTYTTNTKRYKNEYPYQVYRGNIELKLQQSKGLLVDEIDNYIKK